jgi:hypothetical protein
MSHTIRIFVNARAVDVPAGADVSEAVRVFDPALVGQIADGSVYVTDGRGIEISADSTLSSGAILRTVVRSRRGVNVDADS